MSKTKGGGSTRNGRDSNAQRLGVKAFDGTQVKTGSIIIRQRGTLFHPGQHVRPTLLFICCCESQTRSPPGSR